MHLLSQSGHLISLTSPQKILASVSHHFSRPCWCRCVRLKVWLKATCVLEYFLRAHLSRVSRAKSKQTQFASVTIRTFALKNDETGAKSRDLTWHSTQLSTLGRSASRTEVMSRCVVSVMMITDRQVRHWILRGTTGIEKL